MSEMMASHSLTEDYYRQINALTTENASLRAEVDELKTSQWSDKMVQMRLDEIIDHYEDTDNRDNALTIFALLEDKRKLESEVDELKAWCENEREGHFNDIEALRTEVDELRTESEQWEKHSLVQIVKERDVLNAEVDRLKEELRIALYSKEEDFTHILAAENEIERLKEDITRLHGEVNSGIECLFNAHAKIDQQTERIKELTQGDPAWYDMNTADAFRMWADDRKKLSRYEGATRVDGVVLYDADKTYYVETVDDVFEAIGEGKRVTVLVMEVIANES